MVNNIQNETFQPCVAFHPGETLKEKLEEMNMTAESFSAATDIPSYMIEDILCARSSVTADIALAFEEVTNIPAHFWLNTQHNYDDYMLKNKPSSFRLRLSNLRRVAAVF